MTLAYGQHRSKWAAVLRDINRWFFGESLLLWALADSAKDNGHSDLSQFLWFVLWVSAVGVFLVKCYPLTERITPLILIWLVASTIIAYYWFPHGAAMPQLFSGKLRFAIPVLFTLGTAYSWYRAFNPPPTSPSPATHPATAPSASVINVDAPDLFVRAAPPMIGDARNPLGSLMWYVFTAHAKPTNYPVAAALFLECTNRSQKTFQFQAYSVECKSVDGEWQKMPIFHLPNQGKLFWLHDFRKASRMDLVDGVFWDSARRELTPGDTIRGWIFAGFPEQVFQNEFRMRFRDAKLNEFTTQIVMPLSVDGLIEENTQVVGFRCVETGIDISGNPFETHFKA